MGICRCDGTDAPIPERRTAGRHRAPIIKGVRTELIAFGRTTHSCIPQQFGQEPGEVLFVIGLGGDPRFRSSGGILAAHRTVKRRLCH
jgi:hypothetical protein